MYKYEKENYIRKRSSEWNRQHNKYTLVKKHVAILTGSVADLGCNSGFTTFLLAENPKVSSVVGVDINHSSMVYGKDRYRCEVRPDRADLVRFVNMDLSRLGLLDESLDSMISFQTLEHLHAEDLTPAISEMYRVLTPGGYAVVSLPYKDLISDDTHVTEFDEDNLSSLFTAVGFEVREIGRDVQSTLTAVFRKPK
jgi:SAM-dependent methyltransferase